MQSEVGEDFALLGGEYGAEVSVFRAQGLMVRESYAAEDGEL
jgi:hypothetical protein